MTAMYLGAAPLGHFLEFLETDGELVCDKEDPVTLEPFMRHQILYRFGDRHHHNAVGLRTLFQQFAKCDRDPLFNVALSLEELYVFRRLEHNTIRYKNRGYAVLQAEHTAVGDYLVERSVWDGKCLYWPADCPIVSPANEAYGYLLEVCQELHVPATVTHIAAHACRGNKKLHTVVFAPAAQLEVIELGAFSHTTALQKLELPARLKQINPKAFESSGLQYMVFMGNDCTHIGEQAFYRSALREFQVPPKLTQLREEVFADCKYLEKLVFPPNSALKSIGEWACHGACALTSLVLPNTLEKILGHAFLDCTALVQINIPFEAPLHRIDEYAFTNTGLTAFVCPGAVRYIGQCAFSTCKALATFQPSPVLEAMGDCVFYQCGLKSIALPDTCTVLGEKVFLQCRQLQTVRLAEGLTRIRRETFMSATALERLDIPDSVKTIDEWACWQCTSLQALHFSEHSRLRQIGERAFVAAALKSVWLPASVERLEQHCFANNRQLTEFVVQTPNKLQYVGADIVTKTQVLCMRGIGPEVTMFPSYVKIQVKTEAEGNVLFLEKNFSVDKKNLG